jgi:hypothetical protein
MLTIVARSKRALSCCGSQSIGGQANRTHFDRTQGDTFNQRCYKYLLSISAKKALDSCKTSAFLFNGVADLIFQNRLFLYKNFGLIGNVANKTYFNSASFSLVKTL